jgi:hypothetical protein
MQILGVVTAIVGVGVGGSGSFGALGRYKMRGAHDGFKSHQQVGCERLKIHRN